MAEFNLTGLSDVYREAYLRGNPTLTFEVRNGRGRFVVMVFFAEDDGTARDILHLYLAGTRILLEFKMYGSHRKGDFRIFVGETEALAIADELQLGAGGRGRQLDLSRLLSDLNAAIPKSLPPSAQIDVLRLVWSEVRNKLPDIVDEAAKTVLVGVRRLPSSQLPRARTLRKLYLVVDNDPASFSPWSWPTAPWSGPFPASESLEGGSPISPGTYRRPRLASSVPTQATFIIAMGPSALESVGVVDPQNRVEWNALEVLPSPMSRCRNRPPDTGGQCRMKSETEHLRCLGWRG